MIELFGVGAPGCLGHAQNLAQKRVEVGDVFEAVEVGVQPQAHDAQHQNWPQVHPGAGGGLFAGQDFLFQPAEDLGLERGVSPNPLQPRQNGRPFVATAQRQHDLFNREEVEGGIGFKGLAPSEWLMIRSLKSPKRSNKVERFAPTHAPSIQSQRGEPSFLPDTN